MRRETEPRLLAQLPTLLALGVFELFIFRAPALHALVHDDFRSQRTRAALNTCLSKTGLEYICIDKYNFGNRMRGHE